MLEGYKNSVISSIMAKSFQIIPAILAVSEEEYQQKLSNIEDSGVFEEGWVQIDLMDNKFVKNQSVGIDIVAKYPSQLKIEAQLMVLDPQKWIEELVKMNVGRIVFPVEDDVDIGNLIKQIKDHNIQAGISLNPETPIEKVLPFLESLDLVLVMSVHPGFGGQEFITKSVDKIKKLASLRAENSLKFEIEVDGGVNVNVIKSIIEAGCDNVVVGSHLINGDITENLESLWQAIHS